jgi:hypothetical protein
MDRPDSEMTDASVLLDETTESIEPSRDFPAARNDETRSRAKQSLGPSASAPRGAGGGLGEQNVTPSCLDGTGPVVFALGKQRSIVGGSLGTVKKGLDAVV